MWDCSYCGQANEDSLGACLECGKKNPDYVPSRRDEGLVIAGIDLTTTPFVPGMRTLKSFGVVGGQAIIGANFLSDMLAGITDMTGGRVSTYENKLGKARKIALREMAQEAKECGANAVIGVDIDYETLRGTMLMVSASGTAALVEPEDRGQGGNQ